VTSYINGTEPFAVASGQVAGKDAGVPPEGCLRSKRRE